MIKILCFVFGLVIISSCEKTVIENPDPCEEKQYIRMFVLDTLDRPYFFKTTYTYLDDTTLILKYEELVKPSALVVLTDDEIDKISNSINHLTVEAYDYKDSLLLVEKFKVSRDSCHIRYLEGPKSVTIQ